MTPIAKIADLLGKTLDQLKILDRRVTRLEGVKCQSPEGKGTVPAEVKEWTRRAKCHWACELPIPFTNRTAWINIVSSVVEPERDAEASPCCTEFEVTDPSETRKEI